MGKIGCSYSNVLYNDQLFSTASSPGQSLYGTDHFESYYPPFFAFFSMHKPHHALSSQFQQTHRRVQSEMEVTNAFEEIAPPSASIFSAPLHENELPWGIYINHRGPDVKQTLARAIYNALRSRGFRGFLDSEGLQLGDFFPAAIEEAMRSASLHVPIFSPTYAQSPWCLSELSFILKSGKPIIPVFYCVRPTDLRWVAQGKGVYASAFSDYEENHRYSSEKLQEWKMALHKVSFFNGAIINNRE